MVGMNAVISNNVLMLLKQNGKKQNDLAEALGISKQVMSNILSGSRMINAVELRQMADFFHVSMESLMKSPAGTKDVNAVHAFNPSPAAEGSGSALSALVSHAFLRSTLLFALP